jgi:hypothetical protein
LVSLLNSVEAEDSNSSYPDTKLRRESVGSTFCRTNCYRTSCL